MAYSKQKIILYLAKIYLLLLPFGQLASTKISLFNFTFRFHPVDVVALTFLFLIIILDTKVNKSARSVAFIMAAAFSLLLNFLMHTGDIGYEPVFYLFRLISYFAMYALIKTYLGKSDKHTLRKYLTYSIFTAAVIGWLQYLFLPDIRFLQYLGWDDHLYRLTGTFLDPGFTGYILILGAIASYHSYLEEKNKNYIVLLTFFVVSVFFTYSRASFLALFVGICYIIYSNLKYTYKKAIPIILLLFIGIVFLLPRRGGSGAELERIYSIQARIDNYEETLEIWKTSPVFGVGYNNFCNARNRVLGDTNTESNTCFGSDSSILFVLAMTGVIGFVIFADLIFTFWLKKHNNLIFKVIIVSLLVHSVFVNSIFYTWVMGLIAIIFAILPESKRKVET